ncbi:DNA oxidative demethylase ALKBH2-like [Antedon mediterranea]|uniref:DNA oxidative demethylase ALKBH2-like n=1 Tax=Antedon mediterranea TaxID=105859 RepID=UPI003AF8B4A5
MSFNCLPSPKLAIGEKARRTMKRVMGSSNGQADECSSLKIPTIASTSANILDPRNSFNGQTDECNGFSKVSGMSARDFAVMTDDVPKISITSKNRIFLSEKRHVVAQRWSLEDLQRDINMVEAIRIPLSDIIHVVVSNWKEEQFVCIRRYYQSEEGGKGVDKNDNGGRLFNSEHQLLPPDKLSVQKIIGENLDYDYLQLLDKGAADTLFKKCEEEIDYFTGDLTKVKVYGKWFNIPRKQVSFSDPGLTYKYSGNTVPALPWPPFLKDLRDLLKSATGHYFNFVLVNRYATGSDYIGEHKDDEKDMDHFSPIASVSLGQTRMFRFRHGDARGKSPKRIIEPVTVDLKHGTLLMMNYPTNEYWYHSLPKNQSIKLPRINLRFRDIKR